MKRNPKRTLLAWLLTAAMLLSLLPAVALAADTVDSGTCGDDLTWTLDEDGVLTISGTGEMTSAPWKDSYCDAIIKVVVGSGVASIGALAFSGCTGLTSVTIPDSVASIGYCAFSGCTGLTSVTIPDSVTSIGSYAFSGCTGLTSVVIGSGVTSIGDDAFSGCTGLTSITIPDSVTDIGSYAFSGCTGLTSVVIGSGVTSIDSGAFWNCTGLTSITIPDGVTDIESYAFSDCTGLTDITIGTGVTSINNLSFSNTAFYTDESNWEDGVLYLGTYLIDADDIALEENYTIKNGTTVIAERAFDWCYDLTSVTIPESVTVIGEGAFYVCYRLTDVYYSGGESDWAAIIIGAENDYLASATIHYNGTGPAAAVVASGTCGDDLTWTLDEDGVLTISGIGDMTDYYGIGAYDPAPWYTLRESITSVVIDDGVTSIGDNAFYNCTSLTSVTIPDGVTSIGHCAFELCTGLTSVTIPDSVTSIGAYAFFDCTSLTSVTIPDSVTSINSYAFEYCTGLTSVTIGSGVTSIGRGVFSNTGFYDDESNWEDGVLYLGSYLLEADADALEDSYTIKEGTTVIAVYAFLDCTSLTSVTIPDSVTDIGSYAFSGCTGLTSVTIPDSVTSIGYNAFYNCTGLTDVYYSGSEDDWAEIEIWQENDCLTSATIHYSGAGSDTGETHTHSYTATVTKAATCTTAGVRTYTCSCGASYTETIPATGHNWNSGEVTTPATRYTEGEKTYTCTVCGATRTETIAVLTGSDAQFLFSDVTNTSASYYKAVYWAYDYGITKGTSATAFSPSATCTRAQFVTFLWRLAGEPEPASSTSSFTDVTNTSASYYKAVLWAVEQGVTKGTSATTFSPSQTITRAQAVTFLYRYAGEPAVSASSSFTDVTNTSASYYKAVIWAVEKGITNGTTSTTFSPSSPCTRGQMVTFLYRFAVEPLTT